jgi:mannitol-specific phosphotransferase system IIBC component
MLACIVGTPPSAKKTTPKRRTPQKKEREHDIQALNVSIEDLKSSMKYITTLCNKDKVKEDAEKDKKKIQVSQKLIP